MKQNKKSITTHYDELSTALGKNIVKDIDSPYDFITIAETGIRANVISKFNSYFHLPIESTAHLLSTSKPTVYRWIKSNSKLGRNVSLQLMEVTDLFLRGTELFGSFDRFFSWLKLENKTLKNKTPFDLLDLPGGVAKVEQLLGRIEYGVYS
ncbi:MAG: DUF2384 domain-containing protein [Calditrichaeota bacterium]|nr:DUF2384 domain-containing protein [Calditrichota bacterium]